MQYFKRKQNFNKHINKFMKIKCHINVKFILDFGMNNQFKNEVWDIKSNSIQKTNF